MKLSAQGLVVRYPSRLEPALAEVTFEAVEGTLTAVLGPNGSGKSTLMRALLGVVPIEAGSASVGGRATTEWRRSELARAVGAVSQSESVAFPLTVRELVAMGRYPHAGPLSPESADDRAAIHRALEACDLLDLTRRNVTTLSGGEFQRARIARALAQDPGALVLDEPTSSLDVRHQMAILELLRRSADEGMTLLVITHSLDLAARFADRMLLLSSGRVAAEGTPDEVMRQEVLTEVYRWPIAVERDRRSGASRVTPLRPGDASG